MWTREQLKSNAKTCFKRNYWPCVGVALILAIVTGGVSGAGSRFSLNIDQGVQYSYDMGYSQYSYFSHLSPKALTFLSLGAVIAVLAGIAFAVLVGNVFEVGGCSFFIKNRSQRAEVGNILEGFKSGHYGNVVFTMFLKGLYIFLWSLLLVIPGIIKSYEYLMVPYILAENPAMDQKEAFAISKRMMDGQKWKAFVLELSFLGWELLTVFTCGLLGIFYVSPYRRATYAELYLYNKIQAYNEGYIR